MKDYYRLLKEKFPKKSDILTELINLEAICHLPKGTEHFVSDLHGEYPAFDYIMRTASGDILEKLGESFNHSSNQLISLEELCRYIYYPEAQLARDREQLPLARLTEKLLAIVPEQVRAVRSLGQKYTRSKVRKNFPPAFGYIIEELLAEAERSPDKKDYVDAILQKISDLDQLDDLVIALSYTIQGLAVDALHVIGDIYDRGKYPDIILDRLATIRNVDIQWGNHDITWMGAVSGSQVCMVNVIRIAARYNSLALIEDRYGINLRRLIDYSRHYYQPVEAFAPVLDSGSSISGEDSDLLNCVQQATAILQFKLEAQLIARRPELQLQHRQLLPCIDYARQTISLGGKTHALTNFNAGCIDPENPARLTDEEISLLDQLLQAFQTSERLSRHVAFLFEKGAMYLKYNGNLLFHGCIPLDEEGNFKALTIGTKAYAGRELLDFYEREMRKAYRQPKRGKDLATDLFWYLWAGEKSSLFGKQAMTTFEQYYIADKACHAEVKNPYYRLRDTPAVCQAILRAFGLAESGHIINGHTPVREKDGESPIKADGRLLVIDGGFAKAYHKTTGIAGYTLAADSYGLILVPHRPFTSQEEVLQGEYGPSPVRRMVEQSDRRILVKDTTIGQQLRRDIQHLEHLFKHFDDY